jgi:Flp pilus assembly protein TadG
MRIMTRQIRRCTHRGRDERGAVMVFFALFLPVALLLASFVIDIGYSWWHQRHLQVQADAAATAVAQDFGSSCTNAQITADSARYGGLGTSSYNGQVGGRSSTNIHQLINSSTYYNQPSPVDSTVNTNSNWCTSMMADVKMTETGLPWYFQIFSVPFINAHARVQINQATQSGGTLPLAVDETVPKAATAYFINEDTGTLLATAPLTDQGANAQGQEMWNNAALPAAVPINAPDIGVRVGLSGDPTNTACPSTSQYVTCLDSSGNNTTLIHIGGYSNLGTGSVSNTAINALARSVTLQPGTCSDGYFSSTATNCNIGISAHLDFGGAGPNPNSVTVTPMINGTAAPTALTYNTSGPSAGLWTGTAPLTAGSGANNRVDLQITCNNKPGQSACKGKAAPPPQTITGVQRSYSAGPNSGPIQSAAIIENGVSGADSFEECETGNPSSSCTHNLVVSITTSGSLATATGYSNPSIFMSLGPGMSSSQPGTVSCGGGNLRNDLIAGCAGPYAVNPLKPGWVCPDGANPQDCTPPGNGHQTGQLSQGLTARITTPAKGQQYYCANNWVNNNNGGVPILPANDSRIVHVFVSLYGAFGGNGNGQYPILTFATFYITGWDGDPCKSDPGPPDGGSGKAQVWGHFISYIDPNSQNTGTQPCNPNGVAACVAVMTR